MKELSVFVDESGDFGEYAKHSPYYIITIVMHDQSVDISEDLFHLENSLSDMGFANHCVHTGPLLRMEAEYRNLDIETRQRIMKRIMTFARHIDFKYKCFYIEKRKVDSEIDAVSQLSKQLSRIIKENLEFFIGYDLIKIYYDNGQIEVNKILASVFTTLLENVEFRKVIPAEYRLFQVADLICTIKLLELKQKHRQLTNSELRFFKNERTLTKNYIKPINQNEL